MLMLIPIIGPAIIFTSWGVFFAIETVLFFTGHSPVLGLTGLPLDFLSLVLIAVAF